MRRARILLVGLVLSPWVVQAQTASEIKAASEQDHAAMLRQLGLGATRPGVSGNPQAPNAANYDESKAGPVSPLPDALRMSNGSRVTSPKEWWHKRRPELVQLLSRDEYGFVPAKTPAVRWTVDHEERHTVSWADLDGTKHSRAVVTKDLTGHLDNRADPSITVGIELHLTTPADTKQPVPVVLQLAFGFTKAGKPTFAPPPEPGPDWQAQVLERGWGYAVYYPTSLQADNGAGLREGVIGLVNKGAARTPEQWGAIRAWAWGASRILDYLETDHAVDARKVAVMGHSRFGKTALAAMAFDQRFAVAYISSSGAGGANLWRRNFGEQIENVAAPSEYHWMDGDFLRWAADPLHATDLPFDQHEVIALCAPRPVFIGGGGQGDQWQDTKGMFLSAVAASSVYQLLGVPGVAKDGADGKPVPVTELPPVETALVAGRIGFRQHPGGHTPGPNWPAFLDFAAKNFGQ